MYVHRLLNYACIDEDKEGTGFDDVSKEIDGSGLDKEDNITNIENVKETDNDLAADTNDENDDNKENSDEPNLNAPSTEVCKMYNLAY